MRAETIADAARLHGQRVRVVYMSGKRPVTGTYIDDAVKVVEVDTGKVIPMPCLAVIKPDGYAPDELLMVLWTNIAYIETVS